MSKSDHAAIVREAYIGLEIDLPSGKRIQAQPLKLADAIRYLDIMTEFELNPIAKKADETLGVIVREFPTAVGLTPADFDGLTLGEFCDVVKRFFHSRRGNGTSSSKSLPETSPAPAAPTPSSPPPPASSS